MSRDKMINKRDTDSKRVAGQAWKNKQQVEFLRANSSGTAVSTIVEASGFDGNLTTSDTNLQLVAQKVDDLILGVSIGKVDFDFPTPTQVWTLNHSLETLTPGIELYDANGDRVDGAANVNVVNDAQVVVTFGSAIIGKATLIGGATTKTASDTSVDATLFDGNLAPTDTDLQKVAQKVDDLVVGGGGGFFYYNYIGNVDSPTLGAYVSHSVIQIEYNFSVLVADLVSLTPAIIILQQKNYIAIGNQTIEKFVISGDSDFNFINKIGIVAIRLSSGGTVLDKMTIILEKDITPTANTTLTFSGVDFNNTLIEDGDYVFIFLKSAITNNIKVTFSLKCSID